MHGTATVSGRSLGQAYERALRRYDDGIPGKHMVVMCYDPVDSMDKIQMTCRVRDWEPTLNLGDFYDRFCQYDFGYDSPLVGGSTGRDWIEDRIVELHEGMYADRLILKDINT